jgi:DNA-directed RNA polymerase beta subunit/DNA-directed RNA polymerase beta' subunit
MRTFSGAEQFDALKKTVVDSYQKLFPVQKDPKGPSLHLNKIWVDDESLDPHDYVDQKKTRLAGNTWGAPVYASLDLKDASGKVIDHLDKVRLATIPRLTPRGSYIVNGNEHQVANQLRMKMGPYILRSQRGDEYKAALNLGGEFNRRFEVHFDPVNNKYTTKIDQSTMPLYPLMHAMGVSDEETKKAWGADIFAANKVDPTKFMPKYAEKLSRTRAVSPEAAKEAIQTYAKGAVVDPKITEVTLGKAYSHLHPSLMLDTSKKLLNVYQDKEEPDDPENILFKEVLSVEDMLKDSLSQKQKIQGLKFMLSRHLGKRDKIKDMIDFKKLSAPVEYFFTHDDRVSQPEQYNPVHMISEIHKLTMTGTGGIKDPHTISPEIREVHPSHVGFVDPVHTPESEKIGVMLHLATGTMKDGREIRTPVINTKTMKQEYLTPHELYRKSVAFPDEAKIANGKLHYTSDKIKTQRLGKLTIAKPSEVEYILPSHSALFSYSTNLIPFLQNDQGTRAMMGTKHLGQAIPLVEREAPHVQTDIGDGKTFHQAIGQQFSVHAPVAGKVTKITSDHIEIGKTRIPLYNDFPLNQKTYLHHEPVVKVGDSVKEGQLLADSNFTKGGTLALGKNLTVAYLPYPGLTFEDGIVITESAAKKLSSQHIYKHTYETEPENKITDFRKYMAYYPNALSKEHKTKFDADGVVRKGSLVNPNDLLIMGLKYDLANPENATLRKINKALQKPWSNAGVKYKGEFPGIVTDVVKRAGQVDVFVKSVEPAKESDKLSGVHGNKGVITKIIADKDAPRLANGTVPDVFLNPHGIIGRINLGQIYESAAGKIAEKTKKPYVVKNFSGENINEKVQGELNKAGITDEEEMFLPNGKPIGKVHVGKPYILRLAKTGKSGFSARMPMTSYDLNRQPVKGGEEGTKALDLMTFYSMLSHGAKKNLIDAHQKSEQNDEYWHAIEMGKPLPAPKPTFVFNKFISLLHGAGINTVKQGQDVVLAPLTDGAVKRLSHGKIEEPEFLHGKDLKEKRGGFFDPIITGGKFGTNYTHVELPEALPNPVFEKPIRVLTGLKPAEYIDVIAGVKHVRADGTLTAQEEKGAVTGGAGISRLLGRIDVEGDISRFKDKLKTAKTETETDLLNKKMRYLTALKDLNLKPEEAYMRKLVPVVPPQFRPIYEIPKRGLQVAPVNYLYQSVGLLSKAHDYPVMKLLPDSEKAELKADTYKATRALAGLEPVLTRSKDHPIEGFVSQITSSRPKKGFFINKILDRRQDLVGRGVITAAPDLDVDELGIPEKMAWNIFRPFVVRQYTTAGIGADVARREIEEKAPRAKQMLEAAMNRRTVLMNRAPSLHKFSIMAFKPKLTEGLAVRVPPLVLKGFGGDFDGDAVTIHVPTSDQALEESRKMYPSNNLFKPGTGELMIMPSQESAIGLYFLSQSTEGRKKINALLPDQFKINAELSAKAAKHLYNKIAKEDKSNYHKIVFDLKQLGDKTAYEQGFSVGMKDLVTSKSHVKDQIFAKADKVAEQLRKSMKPGIDQDRKVSEVYSTAAKEAYQEIKEDLRKKDNNFYHMVTSGARGKDSQLMQLVSAPGVVAGAKDRPIPVPIKKSYAEGLTTSDYFVSSYGVRKGMMDRVLQTSAPGALNKEIMASTLDNIITIDDCETHKGIDLPVTSPDVYDRFLSKDQAGFKRNTQVTPQLVSAFNRKGIKSVQVRSPLKCTAPKGTCSHCYGLDEFGARPPVGENVGAKTGQAMSEPMTQMTMKTFHTGGVAGEAPVAKGFERIRQLLQMSKHVTGEAALAHLDGKVDKIQKLSTGGFDVHIGGEIHKVAPQRELKVKVGDMVMSGDPISAGVIKPQDLLKYKGMPAAQNYVVDELHKSYQNQDVPMQRKIFETVVRSIGNLTRVVHAPKHAEFNVGDIVPYTTAEHYNETRALKLPTADATGYKLQFKIGNLPQHHEITDKDVSYLRGMGYNHVDVVKDPLIHAPVLTGIDRLPINKKNWMAQLGYRRIKDTLTDGAAEAWKTSLQDTHPVPAFAYGATFGQKKEHY